MDNRKAAAISQTKIESMFKYVLGRTKDTFLRVSKALDFILELTFSLPCVVALASTYQEILSV